MSVALALWDTHCRNETKTAREQERLGHRNVSVLQAILSITLIDESNLQIANSLSLDSQTLFHSMLSHEHSSYSPETLRRERETHHRMWLHSLFSAIHCPFNLTLYSQRIFFHHFRHPLTWRGTLFFKETKVRVPKLIDPQIWSDSFTLLLSDCC